ncbi:hypothetical protein B0H14DRAFT_317883 [Mycena olivaceomarginata]|nr:hypothetical protein B0H14DRAFT_317883 [Mycena olivaceomarginata]
MTDSQPRPPVFDWPDGAAVDRSASLCSSHLLRPSGQAPPLPAPPPSCTDLRSPPWMLAASRPLSRLWACSILPFGRAQESWKFFFHGAGVGCVGHSLAMGALRCRGCRWATPGRMNVLILVLIIDGYRPIYGRVGSGLGRVRPDPLTNAVVTRPDSK